MAHAIQHECRAADAVAEAPDDLAHEGRIAFIAGEIRQRQHHIAPTRACWHRQTMQDAAVGEDLGLHALRTAEPHELHFAPIRERSKWRERCSHDQSRSYSLLCPPL